jgi:ABC-type antimicrobial peptide transport system ATPase subunit
MSKRYGRRRAVEQLTFAVRAGQICALLGSNGAGNASTTRMLVDLSTPDAGVARIATSDTIGRVLTAGGYTLLCMFATAAIAFTPGPSATPAAPKSWWPCGSRGREGCGSCT